MAHSNQVREFLLTGRGVELRDVYVGPSGALLTGSARDALEARERAEALVGAQQVEGRTRALERKRQAMEAQIAALRAEFEANQSEARTMIKQDEVSIRVLTDTRAEMGRLRQADARAVGKTRKSSGARPS
jgi:circadian clock protein KaiC